MADAGARSVAVSVAVDEDLVRQVRERLERDGEPVPPWRATPEERARFRAAVARVLADLRAVPDVLIPQAAQAVSSWLGGMGPLQDLIAGDGVEEVIVRNGVVLVERNGQVEVLGAAGRRRPLPGTWPPGPQTWEAVPCGAPGPTSWWTSPKAIASRRWVPPLSVEGTAINIRVFRERMTLGDLARLGTFDPVPAPVDWDGEVEGEEVADVLAGEGVGRASRGAFGAGDGRPPQRGVRPGGRRVFVWQDHAPQCASRVMRPETVLAVVETFRELQVPSHLHPLRAVVPEVLEEGGGLPPMREVVNVLYKRMRPDVIVFGEVVGEEAVPLLDAMNLGKRVLTTIHGEDAYAALLQLEMLALASGLPLPAVRERVARGVNLVVHLAARGSGGLSARWSWWRDTTTGRVAISSGPLRRHAVDGRAGERAGRAGLGKERTMAGLIASLAGLGRPWLPWRWSGRWRTWPARWPAGARLLGCVTCARPRPCGKRRRPSGGPCSGQFSLGCWEARCWRRRPTTRFSPPGSWPWGQDWDGGIRNLPHARLPHEPLSPTRWT